MLGGVLSILSFSMRASPYATYFETVEQIISWYIMGLGLSVIVILGAIMVHKGHFNLGIILSLAPSLLFPIWFFIFLIFPRPEGVVAMIFYETIASLGYLVLSLMGVIIILITHLKEVLSIQK